MSRTRFRAVATCLGMVTLAAAVACSAEDTPAPTGSDAAPSRMQERKPPRSPLTGQPLDRKPDRPVLIVKIDNTSSAEPQLGLRKADLVVEEPVEGGLTRLATFYYSTLPRVAGPVRSIRNTDAALAAPVRGVLVASGGAGPAHAAAGRAGVPRMMGGPGFSRVGDRPAPYNMMVRPRAVAGKLADKYPKRRPSKPLLPFDRDGRAELGGAPKDKLTATFSPQHTTRWMFRDGRGWVRAGDRAAAGQDYVADTLVVLRVRLRLAGYQDPAGNPVPEAVLKGEGGAWVLAGSHLVKGRWAKSGPRGSFRLTRKGGKPIPLPPGNVWIELVPRSGSVRAT